MTLIQSDSDYDESIYHDHSLCTSSWESDAGVRAIFKSLSINIVSTSHEEEDEKFDLILSDDDP